MPTNYSFLYLTVFWSETRSPCFLRSVFGDVQLGVDVLADDLMWDVCKTDPLIQNGASEEEPEVRVHLTVSPYISLHLPTSPYLSLYRRRSPKCARYREICGRYRGDMREICGRYRGDRLGGGARGAPTSPYISL